jgi:hypothetical protein
MKVFYAYVNNYEHRDVEEIKGTLLAREYLKMFKLNKKRSRDSSVQRRAAGLTAGVRFLAEARDFSAPSIQIGSGFHPDSYAVSTGSKEAGTRS